MTAAPSDATLFGSSLVTSNGITMCDESDLMRLSENLFALRDTCNVYAVREGRSVLLIDFGSGWILNQLGDIGVENVEWVLHTHHHRDQCQGDHALPRETRIAAPLHERPLFEAAENFWRNKQVFDSYNNQSTFFTLTRSIRIDLSLEDYETFSWRGYDFLILPTPGHTHGSITLIADIDDRRVAFTGDLIHSPGRVWNLYDLQHSYGGGEGLDLNIFSLRDLSLQNPDLLLPSHGDPMDKPAEAIHRTIDNLREMYLHLTGEKPTIDRRLKQISPHLLTAPHACCTFYVLLSESGKALFIDYGAASGNHFYAHLRQFESWERQRFVEHHLGELKKSWGVKCVDVVIPTHYHDDHTLGIPYLQKRLGTKLWALDIMADVLENPENYNLPCLLPYPMKVDRRIADGETVRWEEYELEVVHFPGQTEYHMAMVVSVDGKRVLFTGDSLFGNSDNLTQPIIYRNIITAEGHEKCARLLHQLRPDVVAGGHGMWIEVGPSSMATLDSYSKETKRLFESLLPHWQRGINPAWARLVPYQCPVTSDGTFGIALQLFNYEEAAIEVEARLVLPPGWTSSPSVGHCEIAGNDSGGVVFTVCAKEIPSVPLAISADITINSERLGEIAEAAVLPILSNGS